MPVFLITPPPLLLNADELTLIMGSNADQISLIEANVFCRTCHLTTITEYKIYLQSNNDVLLKGSCQKCGNSIARVLETGENKQSFLMAEQIRNARESVKEN